MTERATTRSLSPKFSSRREKTLQRLLIATSPATLSSLLAIGAIGNAHAAPSTPAAPATAASTATTASASSPARGNVGDTTTLPTVSVTARPASEDSTAANTAAIGPLGNVKRVDTPYSIDVIPQQVIASQQVRTVTDALHYIPSVQADTARPQTRGIQGSVVQNSRIDGLNAVSTTEYSTDQFDHIDVLNGLSGALFGPANPAGTFNFVQKRPTDTQRVRVTLGYQSHDVFLRSVDASGTVGEDHPIGYRMVLSDQTGTGTTPNSSIRRQLVSFAFDFHLSPDTVIETNFTHYHSVLLGLPATFALSTGTQFPAALDPSNPAYASRNGGSDNTTDTATVWVKHRIDANWHVDAGVLRQTANRQSTQPTYTLLNNAGSYRAAFSTATATQFTITSNAVYLRGRFDTGPVQHAVSIGTSGFIWNNYNPYRTATYTLGMATLGAPQAFATTWPAFTNRYQSANAWQQSLILSDDVTITPHWKVLLSGSQNWLSATNYTAAGTTSSASTDNGLSGSASLFYKPRADMSAYLTYADSMQQGDTATAGSSNAGQVLAPYRSKEWELGYKWSPEPFNTSLALFRITRPYAYTTSDNVYRVAGEQRNVGVEWTIDGNPTPDLSLFGGITWLNPLLYDTGSAQTDGKRIVGLPRFSASLLAQYRIRALPGLSASAGVRYVGARAGDDANTSEVASYTTLDLGASYVTSVFGRITTVRFTVDNVTNRHYWTDVHPGGLNGYTASGLASAELGAPRTFMASVQFDL